MTKHTKTDWSTAAEVATRLGRSKSATGALLSDMARDGYVKKQASSSTALYRLTSEGVAALKGE